MRAHCRIVLVSAYALQPSCFYDPSVPAISETETTTSPTASTTEPVTSSEVVTDTSAGTTTTGPTTGPTTATTTQSDLPPSIQGFTVNDSTAPPEVGTPGHVTLAAVAEDDVELLEVRFFDGDELLGTVAGAGPHVFEWRVDSVMNGLHKLRAVAVDTAMQSTDSAEIDLNIYMFGGQEVWEQTFADGAGQAVRLDEDGDVYVAGLTGLDDGLRRVRKYTPEGDLEWEVTPGAVSNWSLGGFAVRAGAMYLAGYHGNPYQGWILQLDGAGAENWSLDDEPVFGFDAISVAPLGHLLARGVAVGPQVVIKQFSKEGDELAGIQGPKDSEGGGMAVDASGSIYLSMGVMNGDVIVQKYDAANILLWTRPVESNAVDPVVPGKLVLNPVHDSLGVVCTTLNGDRHFAELSTSGEAMRPIEPVPAWAEAADPGGGWLATYDAGNGSGVRRYSHDWTLLWEFDGPGETINDVTVDAIGNVYATGWQSPNNGFLRKLVP